MQERLTYAINGCLFKVFNTLGNIWHEEVYEKALALELRSRGLSAERQKKFEVFYFDKSVGHYRIDLLVEDTVILELKVADKLSALHEAQLISYLKGYGRPLGILANFGEKSVKHKTFPNLVSAENPLEDRFDFDKIQTEGKEKIRGLLLMANRILVTLGPGYFHQIYRRAFSHELKAGGFEFESVNTVTASYQSQKIGEKDVNFFILGDLLLSAVAVKKLDSPTLSRFRHYISHFSLKRGLIFNFRSLCLDFVYFQ